MVQFDIQNNENELTRGLNFSGSCYDLPIESADESKESLKCNGSLETSYGSAVWDIFRRQDVPKLMEYLQKHHKEFHHINNLPVHSVCSLANWYDILVGL